MKIIAFYLPQFHNIPENDEWWGEGFTEWVNVKKAIPQFAGHEQPRLPLEENYYDLMSDDVKVWQTELAKKYGIYGFCYYHYWFHGHMLLEKPMEQMLHNQEIDLPFCISWANEPWTKAWVGEEKKVLIPQTYGGKKEWKEHFLYLLPFFQDSRYIRIEGKPLFVIYRPEVIGCLNQMLDYFQELAIENGLPGISFAYQTIGFDLLSQKDDSRFEWDIEFQPAYAFYDLLEKKKSGLFRTCVNHVCLAIEKKFGISLKRMLKGNGQTEQGVEKVSYDLVWRKILERNPETKKNLPGAFVGWDNTPRHGARGKVCIDATPDKFETYLEMQIKRAKEVYQTDYLFLDAWNEWAEGAMLEPDCIYSYAYLEAVKEALLRTEEKEG